MATGVALSLVIGACGGGDDASIAGDGSNADITTVAVSDDALSAEPGGGLPPDPAAGADARFDPAVAADAEFAATVALATFGGLEAAAVAILSAYDAGFSYDEIIAAIENMRLVADGTIANGESEQSLGAFQSVSVRWLGPSDIERLLGEVLADVQGNGGEAQLVFLVMILLAESDGYPFEMIVEAIVFGAFTEQTLAEIEARGSVLRREEDERDQWWEELAASDYRRMRVSMNSATEFDECMLAQTGATVDEIYGPRDDDVDHEPSPDGEEDSSAGDVSGDYVGTLDLGLFEFDGTETVTENKLRLMVVDGTVQDLTGQVVLIASCKGGAAKLRMDLDATIALPVGDDVGWSASGPGLLAVTASGNCEEDGDVLSIEDFDGLDAPFEAELNVSDEVVLYTLTFADGETMTGTFERVDD